jgi:DNA-binding CsgD family transcriptional regulator
MARLTHRDFRRLLDCLGELYDHHDLNSFGRHVLRMVSKVVPASFAGYNEFNARRSRGAVILDSPDVTFGRKPDDSWDLLLRQHPLVSHYQSTGDGTARKISDFLPQARYHESPLYRELFCQARVEYMMAFYLPERTPTSVAIALSRDRRDFSERDRQLLNALRPHLFQAYRNAEQVTRLCEECAQTTKALEAAPHSVVVLDAQDRVQLCTPRARQWLENYFSRSAHSQGGLPDEIQRWLRLQQLPATKKDTMPAVRQPLVTDRNGNRLTIRLLADATPGQQLLVMEEHRTELSPAPLQRLGLTAREAEVLLWVAQGKTNPEIGTILGLSPGTVHKHTEHIFDKLGVETRTTAAARAWEVLGRGEW